MIGKRNNKRRKTDKYKTKEKKKWWYDIQKISQVWEENKIKRK